MDGKPPTFVFAGGKMTFSEVVAAVRPYVEDAGYELVDATFEKSYGTDTLTLFIYKKGGVDLSDCEKVTSILDPVLDEFDFCSGGYNFNVSSPGLDRPIVTMDDYRRNEGEEVEIVFKEPQGKKRSAHGKLVSYDEETFTLLSDKGKETVFAKGNAAVVRPYIKF